jgi:hypothetical protein
MSKDDDDIEIDESTITVDADKLAKGRLGITCEALPTMRIVPRKLLVQVPRCTRCDALVRAEVIHRKIYVYQPVYVCVKCHHVKKLTEEHSLQQWLVVAEIERMRNNGRVRELSMVEEEDERCMELLEQASSPPGTRAAEATDAMLRRDDAEAKKLMDD